MIRSARDSHRLLKMQGDGKRKELMRCIRQQQVEKIRSLMKKGVDPNFHVPQTKGKRSLSTAVNSSHWSIGQRYFFLEEKVWGLVLLSAISKSMLAMAYYCFYFSSWKAVFRPYNARKCLPPRHHFMHLTQASA